MFGYGRLFNQSLITFQSRREGGSGVQPPPLQCVKIAFLSFGKSHAKSDRLPTNTFTHGHHFRLNDYLIVSCRIFAKPQ
ncbi:MAG TPA: hypothetical protein VNX46_15725, partial [Candidatus Acidoferrum sp.]|nr:hypothetical protein [Candidatus Acidoferrum sp.]